jgi:hypothetical protein
MATWQQEWDRKKSENGADRIRTCGTGFPVHRFSKPALSTTQPPLLFHAAGRDHFPATSEILANRSRTDKPCDTAESLGVTIFSPIGLFPSFFLGQKSPAHSSSTGDPGGGKA